MIAQGRQSAIGVSHRDPLNDPQVSGFRFQCDFFARHDEVRRAHSPSALRSSLPFRIGGHQK
jgi:hypothetical protein